MRKGELAEAGLSGVLLELAEAGATGCLSVTDPADARAEVYLRAGRVYAAEVPGHEPQLGARLVTDGTLAPEALEEAVEAQRTELQGWRLGELLVHLGCVDEQTVGALVHEHLREAVTDLLRWTYGSWRFRSGQRTRGDAAPPLEVASLLAAGAGGPPVPAALHPDTVPELSAAGVRSEELALDADTYALLCQVDGRRTLTALARGGDLSLHAASGIATTLAAAGLLELRPPVPAAGSADGTDEAPADAYEEGDGSLSRVSLALAQLLGPAREGEDVFAAHQRPAPPPSPQELQEQRRATEKAERWARDAARRDKDAAELAAAQAELEASRQAQPPVPVAELTEQEPEQVQAAPPAPASEPALVPAQGRTPEPVRAPAPVDALPPLDPADAAAFAYELSATASSAPAVLPPAPGEPDPLVGQAPLGSGTGVAEEPRPAPVDHSNTAALLRELSSLGFDADPIPPSRSTPPRPPFVPAPKKRKGLFGRG